MHLHHAHAFQTPKRKSLRSAFHPNLPAPITYPTSNPPTPATTTATNPALPFPINGAAAPVNATTLAEPVLELNATILPDGVVLTTGGRLGVVIGFGKPVEAVVVGFGKPVDATEEDEEGLLAELAERMEAPDAEGRAVTVV